MCGGLAARPKGCDSTAACQRERALFFAAYAIARRNGPFRPSFGAQQGTFQVARLGNGEHFGVVLALPEHALEH